MQLWAFAMSQAIALLELVLWVQSFFQIYIASRGVETLVEDLGPTRLAKTGTRSSSLGGVRGT